jgi:hypothetical protein
VIEFSVPKEGNKLLCHKNNNDSVAILAGDGTNVIIGENSDGIAELTINANILNDVNAAKSQSSTNKTNLDALTKRVDGIVATGGEANQDAYSNIKVGSTTLAATSKTDTV